MCSSLSLSLSLALTVLHFDYTHNVHIIRFNSAEFPFASAALSRPVTAVWFFVLFYLLFANIILQFVLFLFRCFPAGRERDCVFLFVFFCLRFEFV